MKQTFYLPLISWLLILLGCGSFWFKDILLAPINPDEVVWVLDARFYQFRQQKQWQKFQLADNPKYLSWSHDQYRLLDQPQLGKYIFGAMIQALNIDPWDETQSVFLYEQFASSQLDLGSLENHEYPELVGSIRALRILGSVVSFISIAVFGAGIYFLTKSRTVGGLASVFLFFHPTLYYWYRLAVPNNLQILLIITAMSLMMYLLNKMQVLNLQKKVLWVVVGILIASATSIKLNGFFLLFFPFLIWSVQEIGFCFSQREIMQNIINQVTAYLFLMSGFAITFYFLEPELWGQPVRGLRLLFMARLAQHRQFSLFYENYSFVETIWFLLVQFLKITDLFIVKILFGLFLAWGMIKIIRKLSDRSWLNIGWIIFFVLILNIFYANVGFDRYAEWSIYVFSFLSSVGVVDILKKIYFKLKLVWEK